MALGDVQATVGSTLRRDRTGIATVGLKFIVTGPGEDGGAEPWNVLHDYVAPEPPLNLGYMDRDAVKRADGDWDLTLVYEGCRDDGALSAYVDLDYVSEDKPIETCEDFEELAKRYKANPFVNGNFAGWARKIMDPDGGGQMIQNPRLGQTHFRACNVVLRSAFALKNFNREVIAEMGKIQTPLIPEKMQYLLDEQDGLMKWLKNSLKAQWRGNVWLFTLEYHLGKWGEEYRPKNEAAGRAFRSGVDNPQGGVAGSVA
jgi:hypothetical protein